jgi:hypothetical protein
MGLDSGSDRAAWQRMSRWPPGHNRFRCGQPRSALGVAVISQLPHRRPAATKIRFGSGSPAMAGRRKKATVAALPRREPLPVLRDLHLRHRGLTVAVSHGYAEAAGVCLARHHEPPLDVRVVGNDGAGLRLADWQEPDQRTRDAWANKDDATRDGAYSVAIASVEAELGLLAVSRAETRTGADYYVGHANAPDLEAAYRLEVSGVDDGDDDAVARRLGAKVHQARRGESSLPALATVVGFRVMLILIRGVDDAQP